MKSIVTVALLLLAVPAAAQDGDAIYMGIDLTAPAETEPETRSLAPEMRAILEEGVELGCLAFTAPASFAQTADRSETCHAYIGRLQTASEAGAGAEPDPDAPPLRAVPLVPLARAAQAGNKEAQLELGIRFEEGIGGVEQDFGRALELYEQAARVTPARHGMVMRTSDSVDGAGSGSVTRTQTSPRISGLPEARERRDALRERMEG